MYDLENDPNELVNLANDENYGEVLMDLAAKLDVWMYQNGDNFYGLQNTNRKGEKI